MTLLFLRANMYAVLVIGFFLVLLPLAIIKLVGFVPISVNAGFDRVLSGIGLLLGFLGGILSYSCMTTFVIRGTGTAFPTDPPKKFVVSGAYKYVRNPMYIGNLILAFGLGLFLRSAVYLAYAVLLAVVTHFYVVLHEEPRLKRRFGLEYSTYFRMTNRWIPNLLR